MSVLAGITNHEEYSLVLELPDDEKEKTLTLKRDKSIAKDQKKLEEMRKKLHTEDDSKSCLKFLRFWLALFFFFYSVKDTLWQIFMFT